MILGIRAVLELSETSGGIDKNDGFLLPNGKPSVHVDRCRNCIAFVSGRAMLRVMKCWILALTGAALLAGCAPGPLNPPKMGSSGPLNMPAKGSDVEAGAGSLEAVRRQLEGSWTLEWYDIYENGKRRRLPAGGDLVYDAYGNLTLHGELKQPQAIDRSRQRRQADCGIFVEEAELTSIVDSYSCWQVAVITDTLQSITSL